MNMFIVLYAVCSLFVFTACFLSVAKIVLLLKRARGDMSPVFQVPKGFPRFKSKWIDRLVTFLIFNFLSLFSLFSAGRLHGGHAIPFGVFIENIPNYLIIIAVVNFLILSLMYAFNRVQAIWFEKLRIDWRGEVIFWVLFLSVILYFWVCLQAEFEMKMMGANLSHWNGFAAFSQAETLLQSSVLGIYKN
ncbi:MAG: beta-carotene 15,15'-monooxygenase [Pseudomonadota bacterium]|nr:beta-carotene 15,15'-monooxygenase [Pseudomonadota bacterium]